MFTNCDDDDYIFDYDDDNNNSDYVGDVVMM